MRHLFAASAAAFAVAAVATPARADDAWTAPYPGVLHLHRRNGVFDYHVVQVDLRNPRVQVVGTEERLARRDPSEPPGPRYRWIRPSTFARETGAEIAVNANYFDIFRRSYSACGLTVTGGKRWATTYEDARLACDDSIAFGERGRAEVFDSAGLRDAPFAWMDTVVTGSPRLLRDGEVEVYDHPRHALVRNPRTAVGLSRDRGTLYLLVVNGREGRGLGMTCPEAARALRRLGAWDAINLDGGGSSALYVRREGGVVTRFPDGTERGVSNHLGIVFRDPPPESPPLAPPPPFVRVETSVAASAPATRRRATPRAIAAATVAPTRGVRGRGPLRGWGSVASVLGSAIALGAAGVVRRRGRRGQRR